MDVIVKIRGQTILWVSKPKIVADAINFATFHFVFSEDWDDCDTVAQFTQNGKTYNQHISDGQCIMPVEITTGTCQLSVFGAKAGEAFRSTTAPLIFVVETSGFVGDGEPPIPPTPDLYAQLLAAIEAGGGGGGGTAFITDETLSLKNGVLSVNRAYSVEEDNTLPITSAAVHTTVGNIEVILSTI